MALEVGIVGLPGSGKTTLFNVLTHAGAELIDEAPRPGIFGLEVGFVHPHATGGVLAEVVSRGSSIGAIPTFVLPYSPPPARVSAVNSVVFPAPGRPTIPTSSATPGA